MFTQTTPTLGSGLLATILADESFRPSEPQFASGDKSTQLPD